MLHYCTPSTLLFCHLLLLYNTLPSSHSYDSQSYLTLTAETCAVCDRMNPCRVHQRQAGRDGETVTGPPEHGETDE
ncbi:hypothetical protein EYF80_003464 [Liparis tanakae]|uniref:Secreted protein n=1 Tax=Liparis tanakae TaxID=230148 RepID=A0A4Z2J877_9TELE|nr:hypothetical protein EYF80_003464 [Liparis tanakae]